MSYEAMSTNAPNQAEQIADLQATVAVLQQDIDDTRRQSDKVCIEFHGNALYPPWGTCGDESEFGTLQRVVWVGWGRWIENPLEIEDCHFLPSNGGEPRFIAVFRDRKMYSNFWYIMNYPPQQPGIHAQRFVTARSDKRLQFIAKVLVRRGEIQSYWFNWRSGKLCISMPTGQVRTYATPSALLGIASQGARQEIQAKDRARSRRQRRR